MLITIMDNNWKIEYLEVSDIVSSSINIDRLKKSILLELNKQTDKNIPVTVKFNHEEKEETSRQNIYRGLYKSCKKSRSRRWIISIAWMETYNKCA